MPEYNVLIVDDSPFMRKVFSDVIDADAAFKVQATACNGEEAVDLALRLKPDIITMDLEMPHMNGIEALKRIMAVRPTPVIMISAVTDNGTRDTIKALQYGAFDFIRKPDGAVKLDIRQVGEQLIEKLHIAVSTIGKGNFRMLPAVEEQAEPPPIEQPAERAAPAEQADAPPPETPAVDVRPPLSAPPAASPPAPPAASLPPATAKQDPPDRTGGQRPDPAPRPASSPERELRLPKPKPALPKPPAPAKPSVGSAKSESLEPRVGKAPAMPPGPKPLAPVRKPEEAEPAATPFADAPLAPLRQAPGKRVAGSAAFSHVVAIGTSTGGPRALHEVLTGIPAGFPAPILVVQHMPPKFTHSLAQRLDSFCAIRVCEATEGELVESATAYIAPGGMHMTLVKDSQSHYRIRLTEDPPRSGHRPSVDVLFESLVDHGALKRHAVLMTGMGSDGARGMKALQESGVRTTIAESEETCVVYGMPRSAVELGAASHVLPLQAISSALVREVQARKT